jgi:hypothetical protein
MKYKNLFFSFSLEFLIGLIITLLIIFTGPKSIILLAILAIRPFILERESVTSQDEIWFYSYQLGKITLFILSFIIIAFYLIDELLFNENILVIYRDRTIVLLPLFLFLHGMVGLFSLRNRS